MVRQKGVQIPPSVKRKRRQKPTMSEYSRNTHRLGRRPGEQGPRSLLSNQGRVEKWATGKQAKRSKEGEREYGKVETSQ